MRRFGATVVLLCIWAFALPAPVQAQSAKALEVCTKTALRQAMLLKQVTGQRDLRDKAGKVTGVELTMQVRTLGKEAKVFCVYDPAKNLASISTKAAADGTAASPAASPEAVKACTRAGQQQALMIDTVASQAEIKDAKGKVTGQKVVLNVYQEGKPARLICDYDFAARTTALQLRRP